MTFRILLCFSCKNHSLRDIPKEELKQLYCEYFKTNVSDNRAMALNKCKGFEVIESSK